MKVEYRVRPQDLMALSVHYAEISDVIQKSSRREVFGTATTIIAFFTFLTVSLNTYIPFILGAIIALVWIFVWPSMQKSSYRRRQAALFGESKNATTLGKKEMEFEDDVLKESAELHWSQTKLSAIERIDTTSAHAFFIFGPSRAYVIPRETVEGDNYEDFVTAIVDRFKALNEGDVKQA
jgi:hypothetical protein